MKIRIIGTSTIAHIGRLQTAINSGARIIRSIRDELRNVVIIIDENDNEIDFYPSFVTYRQTMEVWEAYGWIDFDNNVITMNIVRIQDTLVIAKENVLNVSGDESRQCTKNTKMLLIEHNLRRFSNNDINALNISQTRGHLRARKLDDEISNFEIEMGEDIIFVSRMRAILYEQINQEL